MKIPESFALAIRLKYCGLNIDREHWVVGTKGGDFYIRNGMATTTFSTERDLWDYVSREKSGILSALASSASLHERGLAQRAEMFLNYSPAAMEVLEKSFEAAMIEIQEAILAALAAVRQGRRAGNPRRTAATKGLCWWEIKSKCLVPHLGPDYYPVNVRLFPSPLEDRTWAIEVRMPAVTPEAALETQRRIKAAFEQLGAKGIKIDSVTQGTWLIL